MFQPLPVFVGLRYSLAREHSFFVSFITWVSLLGVALGVAALITILSVMNGFEAELRTRLLSLSAHATSERGRRADRRLADPDSSSCKGSPGLEGAAPILDTDAMLSRQPAMSGAIVRGIDPTLETAGVDPLRDAMREGKLADLNPGTQSHRSGPHARLPAAGGRGRRCDRHDSRHRASAGGPSDALVPRLQDFQVSGIFEVGLQEHDSVLALVNLEDARGFARVSTARRAFGSSSTMC